MQFVGRAAVGGRIGRLRRRDSAEGLRGQAAGSVAPRPVRAGDDSGWRTGLAGADQCGVARGGGASGVTLAAMEDGEDLDRFGDPVAQQIVGMDHCLANYIAPAPAVAIRTLGKYLHTVQDCGLLLLSGCKTARTVIVENILAARPHRAHPDKLQHGLYLSIKARSSAITTSFGIPGSFDAIARSTLARNHAS